MAQWPRLWRSTCAGLACSGGAAAQAQRDFKAAAPRLLFDHLALDAKDLAHVREGDVVVEPLGAPNAARFDATMIRGRDLDMVGGPALCEQGVDVFLQRGLVALDGEVVVCPAADQVVGQLALGQQRVGGDDAPSDVDRIEHRRGGLDLIGALDLVGVVNAQATDFFWV